MSKKIQPNKIQIDVVIKGRVQGVFYRASTKRQADHLGITGWVKNLPDGSVAAVFSGDEPAVTKMTEWCRKGPSAANVEQVLTQEPEIISDFDSFEIRYQ